MGDPISELVHLLRTTTTLVFRRYIQQTKSLQNSILEQGVLEDILDIREQEGQYEKSAVLLHKFTQSTP